MSIPVIREVSYTDDGCTEYQCLNCYESIETRNVIYPKWKNSKKWKFCPYCGCRWLLYLEESKKEKYYDCPEARTKRLRTVGFCIWSRIRWPQEDWFDWSLELTSGYINHIIEFKKQLEKEYKEDDYIDGFEIKLTREGYYPE